jgi:hypothetical protein
MTDAAPKIADTKPDSVGLLLEQLDVMTTLLQEILSTLLRIERDGLETWEKLE